MNEGAERENNVCLFLTRGTVRKSTSPFSSLFLSQLICYSSAILHQDKRLYFYPFAWKT